MSTTPSKSSTQAASVHHGTSDFEPPKSNLAAALRFKLRDSFVIKKKADGKRLNGSRAIDAAMAIGPSVCLDNVMHCDNIMHNIIMHTRIILCIILCILV